MHICLVILLATFCDALPHISKSISENGREGNMPDQGSSGPPALRDTGSIVVKRDTNNQNDIENLSYEPLEDLYKSSIRNTGREMIERLKRRSLDQTYNSKDASDQDNLFRSIVITADFIPEDKLRKQYGLERADLQKLITSAANIILFLNFPRLYILWKVFGNLLHESPKTTISPQTTTSPRTTIPPQGISSSESTNHPVTFTPLWEKQNRALAQKPRSLESNPPTLFTPRFSNPYEKPEDIKFDEQYQTLSASADNPEDRHSDTEYRKSYNTWFAPSANYPNDHADIGYGGPHYTRFVPPASYPKDHHADIGYAEPYNTWFAPPADYPKDHHADIGYGEPYNTWFVANSPNRHHKCTQYGGSYNTWCDPSAYYPQEYYANTEYCDYCNTWCLSPTKPNYPHEQEAGTDGGPYNPMFVQPTKPNYPQEQQSGTNGKPYNPMFVPPYRPNYPQEQQAGTDGGPYNPLFVPQARPDIPLEQQDGTGSRPYNPIFVAAIKPNYPQEQQAGTGGGPYNPMFVSPSKPNYPQGQQPGTGGGPYNPMFVSPTKPNQPQGQQAGTGGGLSNSIIVPPTNSPKRGYACTKYGRSRKTGCDPSAYSAQEHYANTKYCSHCNTWCVPPTKPHYPHEQQTGTDGRPYNPMFVPPNKPNYPQELQPDTEGEPDNSMFVPPNKPNYPQGQQAGTGGGPYNPMFVSPTKPKYPQGQQVGTGSGPYNPIFVSPTNPHPQGQQAGTSGGPYNPKIVQPTNSPKRRCTQYGGSYNTWCDSSSYYPQQHYANTKYCDYCNTWCVLPSNSKPDYPQEQQAGTDGEPYPMFVPLTKPNYPQGQHTGTGGGPYNPKIVSPTNILKRSYACTQYGGSYNTWCDPSAYYPQEYYANTEYCRYCNTWCVPPTNSEPDFPQEQQAGTDGGPYNPVFVPPTKPNYPQGQQAGTNSGPYSPMIVPPANYPKDQQADGEFNVPYTPWAVPPVLGHAQVDGPYSPWYLTPANNPKEQLENSENGGSYSPWAIPPVLYINELQMDNPKFDREPSYHKAKPGFGRPSEWWYRYVPRLNYPKKQNAYSEHALHIHEPSKLFVFLSGNCPEEEQPYAAFGKSYKPWFIPSMTYPDILGDPYNTGFNPPTMYPFQSPGVEDIGAVNQPWFAVPQVMNEALPESNPLDTGSELYHLYFPNTASPGVIPSIYNPTSTNEHVAFTVGSQSSAEVLVTYDWCVLESPKSLEESAGVFPVRFLANSNRLHPLAGESFKSLLCINLQHIVSAKNDVGDSFWGVSKLNDSQLIPEREEGTSPTSTVTHDEVDILDHDTNTHVSNDDEEHSLASSAGGDISGEGVKDPHEGGTSGKNSESLSDADASSRQGLRKIKIIKN